LTISEHISLIFDDFIELKGDRKSGDDKMVLGGLARLNGQKLVVIGYSGDTFAGSIKIPASDGYRKSIRLMNLAESFEKPVVVLIDIPEVQSLSFCQEKDEYLVQALESMINLKVPVVSAIMGTYNSYLTFDLCASDRILMAEQAICVIPILDDVTNDSPVDVLSFSSQDLLKLNLVDGMVEYSSDSDNRSVGNVWKKALYEEISQLSQIDPEVRIEQRFIKLQTRFTNIKSMKSDILANNNL
jgi:acetyl-CoA carboxylase carboxyl transferase subunit alpha